MYNLIKCSYIHSKTLGSLWQCYREEPFLDGNTNIIDFSADNNSLLFKVKEKKQEAMAQKMLKY